MQSCSIGKTKCGLDGHIAGQDIIEVYRSEPSKKGSGRVSSQEGSVLRQLVCFPTVRKIMRYIIEQWD